MITIYTDGACKENERNDDGVAIGRGGWAYVILDQPDQADELSIIMSACNTVVGTTNQEMEIIAAAEALTALRNHEFHDYSNMKITLYSDSAYLINCLNDKWYLKWLSNDWKNSKGKAVLNREAWEKLLASMDGLSVTFFHVKRNTTRYIRIVDEMAKRASKIETTQEL